MIDLDSDWISDSDADGDIREQVEDSDVEEYDNKRLRIRIRRFNKREHTRITHRLTDVENAELYLARAIAVRQQQIANGTPEVDAFDPIFQMRRLNRAIEKKLDADRNDMARYSETGLRNIFRANLGDPQNHIEDFICNDYNGPP